MGEAELDFFFMLFAKLKFQVDKKCNMKSKTNLGTASLQKRKPKLLVNAYEKFFDLIS